MARYIYQGTARDGMGRVIKDATVAVYLAGTTTAATIYATEVSTPAIVGSTVTSGSDGYFSFWVSDSDTLTQFKLVITKASFDTRTYDDVVVFPTDTSAAIAAEAAKDAAEAAELACSGYQAAVQAEGATQVALVDSAGAAQIILVDAAGAVQIGLCEDQVTLASNAAGLAAEYAQKAEDSAITGHPTEYSAYHWSRKAQAVAGGGLAKISSDDTTAATLDAKIQLASDSGLTLSVVNPAGNEHFALSVDLGSDPGLEITADGLEAKVKANAGVVKDTDGLSVKVKASSGLNLDADGLWVDLGTDPGLEFSADGLEVKIKTAGGLVKDADGLSVSLSSGLPTNHISGLGIAYTSTTTYTVGAGKARDGADAVDLTLASAMVKSLSSWAAGSGNGSLDTGSIGASAYYYVWLIHKTADNSTDILLSLSESAPTMPSGYSAKRVIGRIRTNAANQINYLCIIPANPMLPGMEIITATRAYIQPPWAPDFILEVVGGGAGGTGASATNCGAGGSAGGYGKKVMRGHAAGTSTTATIGAAGASNGAGGTSSFGSIVSCGGGSAGSSFYPGAGGTVSGADISLPGQPGQPGDGGQTAPINSNGGQGGSTPLGFGGRGGYYGSGVGTAGNGYGSGGGGDGELNGPGTGGAAGAIGVVILTF